MPVQYEDIAVKDFKRAKSMFRDEDWNACARFCQQAVEKYFKAVIEIEGEVSDLPIMSVHKLSVLGMRLGKIRKLSITKEVFGDMTTLTTYYFDTDYPGKNYIELDRQMAENALTSGEELIKWAGPVNRYSGVDSSISTDPLK